MILSFTVTYRGFRSIKSTALRAQHSRTGSRCACDVIGRVCAPAECHGIDCGICLPFRIFNFHSRRSDHGGDRGGGGGRVLDTALVLHRSSFHRVLCVGGLITGSGNKSGRLGDESFRVKTVGIVSIFNSSWTSCCHY